MLNQAWEQARPPPRYTPDTWAEERRYLSPEASELHGKWSNANSPHVVEPLKALAPWDETEQVFLMWSSQSSKSEVLLNWLGYTIDMDPGPGLLVQPNLRPMAEVFVKDRIEPMIRDSPTLAAKVYPMAARGENASTRYHKKFAGGQWSFAGAASPAQLASRPIRYAGGDEIDRWEKTREGSALKLLWKRTGQFQSSRKGLFVSSPTFEGFGVHGEYQTCLQHEWQLQCQHCDETQMPKLKHFTWDMDELSEPCNIRYACEHCGCEHDQVDERKLKRSGRWVCTNPGKRSGRRKGYWLNQFGVLRVSWLSTIIEWLEGQDDVEKLQATINTVLAETWTGTGEKLEWEQLYERREAYPTNAEGERLIPASVVLLVLVVDTQDDRLEWEVIGYEADGRTTWSIERGVLVGDPDEPEVWDALDDIRSQSWPHESGGELILAGTGIDSRGHKTQAVYAYCNRKGERNCFALVGEGGWDKAVFTRTRVKLRGGGTGKAWRVGVDPIKSRTHKLLTKGSREAGRCHWPLPIAGEESDHYFDEEYFQQLCAESLETRKLKGFEIQEWNKNRPRNEAFDLRNYAYAVLRILRPDFAKYETRAKLAQKAKPRTTAVPVPTTGPVPVESKSPQRATKPASGGWMSRSRGFTRR